MTNHRQRRVAVSLALAVCSILVAGSAHARHARGVSFIARRDFDAGRGPQSVAVGDFNGDGVEDLAVANYGSSNLSVLLGNGDGSFQGARNFGAGLNPLSVAVCDFNGDGLEDLAVANAGSNDVSVLINNTPQPPAEKTR